MTVFEIRIFVPSGHLMEVMVVEVLVVVAIGAKDLCLPEAPP